MREGSAESDRQFPDRLYGIHLKDFLFAAIRKQEEKILGEGNLDLKELFHTLGETGFDGTISFEYEQDVDDPMPALIAC